jgi:hypothetical protein
VVTLCAQETTERNPGRVLFAFLFNLVLLLELHYAEKVLVLENKWGAFLPCSGAYVKSRENPVCCCILEEGLAVLQTASGLQGEEPLVDRRMYDKGNRQNGSVTSG